MLGTVDGMETILLLQTMPNIAASNPLMNTPSYSTITNTSGLYWGTCTLYFLLGYDIL